MLRSEPFRTPFRSLSVISAAVLACLCALLVCAPPVFAEEQLAYVTVDQPERVLQAGGLNASVPQSAAPEDMQRAAAESDVAGFQQAVRNALEHWNFSATSATLNVSAYRIPSSEVFDLYYQVLNSSGAYFYIGSQIGCSERGGYAYTITMYAIDYDNNGVCDYTEEDKEVFSAAVERIVAGVGEGWSDEEKALYLHDCLITRCAYDTTGIHRDAYAALVGGTSVCQGYALAYGCLLNRCGIPSDYISSEALGHAWNLVTIDGASYYVDCTWDDPTGAAAAHCGHANFLRSKAGMESTGHEAQDWIDSRGANVWADDAIGTSPAYDSAWWTGCTSAIPHVGRAWAYLPSESSGEVRVHDYASDADRTLTTLNDTWYVWGSASRYYMSRYHSLTSNGAHFFVSCPARIDKLTTVGEKTTVYTLTGDEQATGYIYGMTCDDRGMCTYYLQQSPGGAVTGSGAFDSAIHVTNVSVSPSTAQITWGDTLQLAVFMTPDNATDKMCTWVSGDESVATVDAHGLVTGVNPGTTQIIVTTEDAHEVAGCTVTVVARPLDEADVSVAESQTYSGDALTPAATVVLDGVTLVAGTDYALRYSDNVDAGKAVVTVTGIGHYTGQATGLFTIAPLDVNGDDVLEGGGLATDVPEYTGARIDLATVGMEPLRYRDRELSEGVDYAVAYEGDLVNVTRSPVTATLSFGGNFTGSIVRAYTIVPYRLSDSAHPASVTLSPNDFTYDGTAFAPQVAVVAGAFGALLEGVDYVVDYSNNVDAGIGHAIVTGCGNFGAALTCDFTIAPRDIAEAEVLLTPDSFLCDDTSKMPTVAATIDGKELVAGRDIALEFVANVAVGTARVVLSGMGNYTGNTEATFAIALDVAGIERVTQLIAQIGDVTLESADAIVAAQSAYDALCACARAEVPEAAVAQLQQAGAQLQQLQEQAEQEARERAEREERERQEQEAREREEQERRERAAQQEADRAAAAEVAAAIGLLPPGATSDDAASVNAAWQAYQALTPAQKALIPTATVSALQKTHELVNQKQIVKGGVTYARKGAIARVVQVKAAKKKITIAARVTIGGKAYKVSAIKKGAFAGSAAKTVVIKSKTLTKAKVKKCFRGSKAAKITIKAPAGKKRAYAAFFTKKWTGARAIVVM